MSDFEMLNVTSVLTVRDILKAVLAYEVATLDSSDANSAWERRVIEAMEKLREAGITAEERIELADEIRRGLAISVNRSVVDGAGVVAHAKPDVLPAGSMKEILKAAKAYAVEKFAGKTVQNRYDGTDIFIGKNGIDHALSGRSGLFNALVATDLENLIGGAVHLKTSPDTEGRVDDILRFHYYGAKMDIGERIADVGITVREHRDGKRYYHHYELKTKPPASGGLGESQGGMSGATEPSTSGELGHRPTQSDTEILGPAQSEVKRLLDSVANPLDRVRLSGQLAVAVAGLGATTSPLAKVKAAGQVSLLIGLLTDGKSPAMAADPVPAVEPSRLKNYGWDAVELSKAYGFDELRQLREQVEAEHANPRDGDGRYFENGQPTIYLYDKKGRWKLDKLAWAVTYQLQEKKDADQEPQPAGHAPEIVEYTTKKNKVLRGVVRTDLSFAEAKAIDEYTFRYQGGWFIREKHLPGMADLPPSPAAATPEQLAQAEADRQANAALTEQKKRQAIADKLQAAGQSVVEKAEQEIGRDRLTNTARRANMAAGVMARLEADRATGLTMQNLAAAIASGEAKHLAGITSRAAVETLQHSLRSAMAATERELTYAQQMQQRGRTPDRRDVSFAKFPAAKWDAAGASRSQALEKIKGKRGAPALADKIRYATEIEPETYRALSDMLGKKEADYLLGWWNVEQIGRIGRLQRAGISNTEQLQAALTEYLQFREGARAEDPIKKAERAIIGQKVGIDFFPTPAATAMRMAQLARISKGDRVLEPSAGNGNLADAAKAEGGEVDVIEISSQLRAILEAKGYNVVGFDFDTFEPEEKYDSILMNPPFSGRRDAGHIQRAYRMLKTGGTLVAIAGEGVFIGSDIKAVQFRDWLDAQGAEVEALEQGTFKDANLLTTTGANARLIVIHK